MFNFIQLTFKLWYEVPGMPPLWKCAAVAFVVCKGIGAKDRVGCVEMDEVVD